MHIRWCDCPLSPSLSLPLPPTGPRHRLSLRLPRRPLGLALAALPVPVLHRVLHLLCLQSLQLLLEIVLVLVAESGEKERRETGVGKASSLKVERRIQRLRAILLVKNMQAELDM